MDKELSKMDIVLFALYKLGGVSKKIRTEEIAWESYQLAREKFSWCLPKFIKMGFPDKLTVLIALETAHKEKYGRLVLGRAGRDAGGKLDGWIFTPQGVSWIKEVVSSDSESVPIKGRCHIIPVEGSNYAVGEVVVQGRRLQTKPVEITASINGDKTTTKVKVTQKDESGVPIRFKIVSKSLGIYRAAWSVQEPNLLEISATHDSIKRYLGPEPDYTSQEEPYFRVLLAEIIAESVCRKVLELEVKTKPWDFKDDFIGTPEVVVNTVLSHLQKRMRDFVATAHTIMLGSTEIK